MLNPESPGAISVLSHVATRARACMCACVDASGRRCRHYVYVSMCVCISTYNVRAIYYGDENGAGIRWVG